MSIVCLGEAIVDLVCEREADSIADADEFRPHPGGALANVAVAARRSGATTSLAGGVGEDPWGRWLRDRLLAEGIDLSFFSLVEGLKTPLAFVVFDHDREPSFQIYGDGIEAGIRSVGGRLEAAIGTASAVAYGSNTLVGPAERALCERARELAAESEIPVLFDPNLREHRWPDLNLAIELCREACRGAFAVRANASEARRIAGLDRDAPADAAAEALCSLGTRLAVVTRGARGAVMRGAAATEHPGVEVREMRSPLGAGDAFMGALAAGLAAVGWRAERAAEALPAAVEAGARTCESWGAMPSEQVG